MKQKKAKRIVDPKTKRRYNLCNRLRMRGIEVAVDSHAIQINPEQLQVIDATGRKYIKALHDEYHYVMQTFIPSPTDTPTLASVGSALTFRRRAPSKQ